MLVRKTKLKRSFCISQKYSFVSLKCKAFNSEYSCTKIRFLLLLKIRIKVGQGTSPYNMDSNIQTIEEQSIKQRLSVKKELQKQIKKKRRSENRCKGSYRYEGCKLT